MVGARSSIRPLKDFAPANPNGSTLDTSGHSAYISTSNKHQLLILLCITWNKLPVSFCQPCINHSADMSHSLIHLPPALHFHAQSSIHGLIPGSILTFSTNLIRHSLLAPTGLPSQSTLNQTYYAQWFSFFSYISFFLFGSCGRLSWLNCQLLNAH